eukprot:scaffold10783_cov133-Skeletonema_dohrnii-CCMP3373.AAC.4
MSGISQTQMRKSQSGHHRRNRMKDNTSNHKAMEDNHKTKAVVLCADCDKLITDGVRTKGEPYIDVEGVGYRCSKCDDSTVYCQECSYMWGSFCAGEMCNKFYCDACRPEYLGEEGEDQYCERTCMGKHHPDYKKYSRHRVPYSDCDGEQEVDKIASILGYQQCKGITQKGYRCEVKSTYSCWSALSLQSGDDFCMHHGGR